jgi:CheY-like chemotaxis protein
MTTESTDTASVPQSTMQRSSRDAGAMASQVAAWLATQLPEAADPEVSLSGGSDANGMSSETILADVSWTEDGARHSGAYVVRMAPSASDVPVFASYRLDHQYDAIRLVDEHHPDIVLMDIAMPNRDGIEATRLIRASDAGQHVVIYTGSDEYGDVARADNAGAAGFLHKDALMSPDLADALHVLHTNYVGGTREL